MTLNRERAGTGWLDGALLTSLPVIEAFLDLEKPMGFGKDRSIDTAGSWQNHLERMKRWRDRSLSRLNTAGPDDVHDVCDFLLAYFVWCHSFREWLIETDSIKQTDLDIQLSKYPEWKICRDIANRCRHYDLIHNPTDKHWSMGREYDIWAKVENRPERLIVFLVFNGEKHNISDLVHSAFRMWQEILNQRC